MKASSTENNHEPLLALAQQLWTLRWSLLKKPANLSREEKQAIAELAREDAGFVHSFRNIIRQLVNIFDHTHSEAQATLRLQQLPVFSANNPPAHARETGRKSLPGAGLRVGEGVKSAR